MATRRFPAAFVLFAVATMLSAPSFTKEDSREAALRQAEQARFDANISADANMSPPTPPSSPCAFSVMSP
jgi:hypothetical protein